MKKYSAAVCTLGCRVNQYESDCVISELTRAGFELRDFSGAGCDLYIINTCTVTAASDKKSRQMIRRAKKLNPGALIAVCGCFSQSRPELFEAGGHAGPPLQADIILGTPGKTGIAKLALDILDGRARENVPQILVKDIGEYTQYENIGTELSGRARVYIKIQDGCEAACSFCIVPQVRGCEKSRPYEHIYAEAKRFEQAGAREIVLTGIEISGYGRDKGDSLTDLLERLDRDLNITVRLGSVDPFMLRSDFADRIARLTKIAPHLHLSLQSGSTRVLNLMRRRYNAEQALANISYARSKISGLNLTADIIAGFPGESERDFEQTLELVQRLRIYHAHTFTYSKRPGTPAADYAGHVPEHIKNARSKALAQVCARIRAQIHAESIGREFCVILEDLQGGEYTAKTPCFMDVRVKTGAAGLHGTAALVKITGGDADCLCAYLK